MLAEVYLKMFQLEEARKVIETRLKSIRRNWI
jgi:hypothetical protein